MRLIIEAIDGEESELEVSLDCGLTTTRIELGNREVSLGGRVFEYSELSEIADRFNGIIKLDNGSLHKLEIFSDHFYKLRPTSFAPTVEIDGVSMHRTEGIDPWEDSRMKVEPVVKKGDAVLDTCGGLGYTAIWAVKMGAREVLSVEKSESIRTLREENPHSRAFYVPAIKAVDGDINSVISDFEPGRFNSIIHDPPRFSLAGEIYGEDFYAKLADVITPGGRMYHYTGAPYSKGRGRRFLQGIIKRLSRAGFAVKPYHQALGILAVRRKTKIYFTTETQRTQR